MLKSSLGWGGGCFRKDVLDLVYIARSLHLDKVADYWASVVDMNEDHKARLLHRVISCMHGSVTGKKIAVLGFAFKKNTSDTKESAAISLVKGLLAEEAIISIYDPMVKEDRVFDALRIAGVESYKLGDMVRVYQSAYDACDYADAVIVATEWDELRTPTTFTRDNRQGSPERAAPQPMSPCMTPDSDENMFSPDNPPKETSLDWERITRRMKEPNSSSMGGTSLTGITYEALDADMLQSGKLLDGTPFIQCDRAILDMIHEHQDFLCPSAIRRYPQVIFRVLAGLRFFDATLRLTLSHVRPSPDLS